jgi:hypothetical protein
MLCKSLWATAAVVVGFVTATPSSSSPVPRVDDFVALLSDAAEVYYPGSEKFASATLRWGAAQTPQYDIVVKVATQADVQEAVRNLRPVSGHILTLY